MGTHTHLMLPQCCQDAPCPLCPASVLSGLLTPPVCPRTCIDDPVLLLAVGALQLVLYLALLLLLLLLLLLVSRILLGI